MGCGRAGAQLAKVLALEGQDVTVIDKDESAFERLGVAFKGKKVVGVGFDRESRLQLGKDRRIRSREQRLRGSEPHRAVGARERERSERAFQRPPDPVVDPHRAQRGGGEIDLAQIARPYDPPVGSAHIGVRIARTSEESGFPRTASTGDSSMAMRSPAGTRLGGRRAGSGDRPDRPLDRVQVPRGQRARGLGRNDTRRRLVGAREWAAQQGQDERQGIGEAGHGAGILAGRPAAAGEHAAAGGREVGRCVISRRRTSRSRR